VKTRQKRRRPKVPSSFYFLRVVVVIPHDSKEMEGRSHEMKTTIVLHYVAEREREEVQECGFWQRFKDRPPTKHGESQKRERQRDERRLDNGAGNQLRPSFKRE
jgi:hypothetical protein